MKEQNGFTLIELMIVVAIIGILAAIAVPQYQGYVARAQMTRMVGELSALKTAVEDRMNHNNSTNKISDLGYTTSNLTTNAAVVMNTTIGVSKITATLNGDVSSAINGAIVNIIRAETGSWSCSVASSSNPGWDDGYAPSGCPVLATDDTEEESADN
ncbi:UNVERIFIED_CONTAM: hypothetical protein GTU68_052159 [Idotea baltica]|nr:hypothetical protein [Idotea baltica]